MAGSREADAFRPNRRVTLIDVARDAGVSPSTVSLVINGAPRISAATVENVRRSMERLRYQYDGRAAALRGNIATVLGLLLNDVRSRYYAELTMAVEEAVAASGYALVVGYTHDDPDRQAQLLRSMAQQRVGGVILLAAPGTAGSAAAEVLRSGLFPHVTIGRTIRGLTDNYVGTDNRAAARMVGQHLLDLGVGSTAMIGGNPDSSAFRERMRSLRQTVGDRIVVTAYPSPATADGGRHSIRQALADAPDIQSVISFSDTPTLGIVHELRERGMTIGRDIAVVAFDDNPEFELLETSLTSVATFPEKLGARASEVLLDHINHPDHPPKRVILAPELRVRDSTAHWRP